MGDTALAALIGVIGLMVGLALSVTGQSVAGRQALHREREARLFDARRQIYAAALARIDHWIGTASPGHPEGLPRSIDWTEGNVLGADLVLLASPAVRPLLTKLAATLNDHAERIAEARDTHDLHPTIEQVEAEKTRESLICIYDSLRRLMLDDLGV